LRQNRVGEDVVNQHRAANADNLDNALAFCRLPYGECWIEVAQAERKSFAAAPLGDECDGKVKRIGSFSPS
jgi:hypothetical protein